MMDNDDQESLYSDYIIDDDLDETKNGKNGSSKPTRQLKPRVSAKWSDEDVFKLIACVESAPLIWNPKDEKYRNKSDRQFAWIKIAEDDFDGKFTETELVAKWSNMRIQYRSYLLKSRESGQSANECVKWKFYKPMDFLDHSEDEQSDGTVSNMVINEARSLDSFVGRSPRTITRKVLTPRKLSQSSNIGITATTTAAASTANITTPPDRGTRNLANQLKEEQQPHDHDECSQATNISAVYIATESRKKPHCQYKEREGREDDTFDTFGKYVAAEIRTLPDPDAAQRVRFKVARFLMDCIESEHQLNEFKQETQFDF